MNKPFDDSNDCGSSRIVGQTQHDKSGVILRREFPDIGKVQIPGKQDCIRELGARGDVLIRRCGQSAITGKFNIMAALQQKRHD